MLQECSEKRLLKPLGHRGCSGGRRGCGRLASPPATRGLRRGVECHLGGRECQGDLRHDPGTIYVVGDGDVGASSERERQRHRGKSR